MYTKIWGNYVVMLWRWCWNDDAAAAVVDDDDDDDDDAGQSLEDNFVADDCWLFWLWLALYNVEMYYVYVILLTI